VKLVYKSKKHKKNITVDCSGGFKSGYAHLHYWSNDTFEHCIPYSDIDSFKIEGVFDDKIRERSQPSAKLDKDG
jgi:hypothetical protein